MSLHISPLSGLCVQMFPFSKDTSHTELGLTLVISLLLDYLCKDPVSQ